MTPPGARLLLLPAPLEPETALAVLPAATLDAARRVTYFLAENARTTRALLQAIGHPLPLAQITVIEIGHEPDPTAIDAWLAPLARGERDAAIVAEAGCPAVADPGATLVACAHRLGLRVEPLVGPSAILLALMASGLEGQRFRFHGYLPRDAGALAMRLAELDSAAHADTSQIFIETPYRNRRLFEAVLAHCAPSTRLCVAVDLTGAAQSVCTRTVAAWRALDPAARPPLERRPAIFVLQAEAGAARRPQRQTGERNELEMAAPRRAPKRRATRSTRSSWRV